jgi:hypothetical protein
MQGGFRGGFYGSPNANNYGRNNSGGWGGMAARRRRDPWDEARDANERRRDKIEKGYKRRRRAVMSKIGSMGRAGRAEIDNEFTGVATNATQDLASRGLSGTTVAPTVQTAVSRDKGAALSGLRERMAGLKASYLSDLEGDRLGFLERIEEEYPDYGGLGY